MGDVDRRAEAPDPVLREAAAPLGLLALTARTPVGGEADDRRGSECDDGG
jgi:hypothetical protein